MLTLDDAKYKLEFFLKVNYNLSLNDIDISDVKGYWRIKKPCDNTCKHPIHSCLGNKGSTNHTIYFAEGGARDSNGHFLSPYRVWNIFYDNMHKTKN